MTKQNVRTHIRRILLIFFTTLLLLVLAVASCVFGVGRGELAVDREEQLLSVGGGLVFHEAFEEDALMAGVLVDEQQGLPCLHQDVGVQRLADDAVFRHYRGRFCRRFRRLRGGFGRSRRFQRRDAGDLRARYGVGGGIGR